MRKSEVLAEFPFFHSCPLFFFEMPTEIVTSRRVADFQQFAQLGQSNIKMEDKISLFLAELVDTTDRDRVKALCDAQLDWLRSKEGGNYSARSIPNRVTKYKKAIQACFKVYPIHEGLEVPIKTKSKGIIDVHIAQQFLQSSCDESDISIQENKRKTDADQDNSRPFNLKLALQRTEEIIRDKDWRVAAAGIIFACQCRPVDLVLLGDVKAESMYKVRFTTRAKQRRGKAKTRSIFTLVRADIFVDAFTRLRREPNIQELRGLTPSEADSRTNKTINRKVREAYGGIIPEPYTESVLSCHNLRAAGAKAAYHLYAEKGQGEQRFIELQLIHDSKAAAANYDDYFCTDANGEEITVKGLVTDAEKPLKDKPKSEQRRSLTLDLLLKEEITDAERWGKGTQADKLSKIVATAKKSDRLSAQLARECEKRQKLELEIAQLRAAQGETGGNTKPVSDESSDKPAKKSKPAEKPVKASKKKIVDWRSVPNSELNGDRRSGAYVEKLRRSVESIQEYNAGRDTEECFAITGSILRQLTKVKPGKIKEWMEGNAELIAHHNAGLSERQNTGKPKPRDVIKWSEAAYGSYEWQVKP